MDMNKIVCECFGITNGMIKEAIDTGAATAEEVIERTGASTGCGVCADAVNRVAEYFLSEKNS